MNALFLTDGYKTGYHQQYPKGTTMVYSNFTPRSNKYAPYGCDKVVSFGQQMVFMKIHEFFHDNFFSKKKEDVCGEMKRELSLYLGAEYDVSHFENLHDLGYLPIEVKVIEEGNLVPIKVPLLTICNTHPDFYWITNYLETIISNLLWKPITSATIAYEYRKILKKWQNYTDVEKGFFVDYQAHDFSMRGMDSVDAVISSGLGHLTSFLGTDSLPAIYGARKYYYMENDNVVGSSVNATEHSVMCAGGQEDEIKTFERLLEIYPTGILSVVSDTWDLWKVCTEYLVVLKENILKRDGKLVIRPDSGNPADIICGFEHWKFSPEMGGGYYYNGKKVTGNIDAQYSGVIELLWDIFGGTINNQGYKVLDTHIGVIYGDSITISIADEICRRLEKKGFASTNVVFGVGSFTYQYNTRDTFGFAMKATYVEVNFEGREIFKNPITDNGVKKSAKGLLKVIKDNENEYKLIDGCKKFSYEDDELITIYKDGLFYNVTNLNKIREKLF